MRFNVGPPTEKGECFQHSFLVQAHTEKFIVFLGESCFCRITDVWVDLPRTVRRPTQREVGRSNNGKGRGAEG